uniref:Uncharacterized protein n=1 Tax=viral metagenome TaxID=1070528 RepID=A0A6H1ZZ01_9ZZZZ
MKERGFNGKQIWMESQRRGEVIPYKSFTRHFRVCWKTKKSYLMKESTDYAKEIVARKFIEQMNIIDEIGNSLKILKAHIEGLQEEMKEGTVNWKNLLASLAEIRMILKFLWDISKQVEIKPEISIDKIKENLMVALREIPFEYASIIEKALET